MPGSSPPRVMSPAGPRERIAELSAIRLKHHEKVLFLLGSGPKTELQLIKFREHIVTRYDWDQALKYLNDKDTRFLNKARGLITFNGLTLTALSTLMRLGNGARDTVDTLWLSTGITFTLVSAVILLLTHFLVDFGPSLDDYLRAKTEFPPHFIQVIKRAKWISIAGIFSLLSLVPLAYASYGRNHAAPHALQIPSSISHSKMPSS
jgi:hypothetical protein